MKPTKDWQRDSAAFRISVALENKDAVFDPDLWPVNVNVKIIDSGENISDHLPITCSLKLPVFSDLFIP
jgi:hypothetical protein